MSEWWSFRGSRLSVNELRQSSQFESAQSICWSMQWHRQSTIQPFFTTSFSFFEQSLSSCNRFRVQCFVFELHLLSVFVSFFYPRSFFHWVSLPLSIVFRVQGSRVQVISERSSDKWEVKWYLVIRSPRGVITERWLAEWEKEPRPELQCHLDRRRWRSHQLTSDLKRCLLFRKCLRWLSRKAVLVPTSVIGGLGAPERLAILLDPQLSLLIIYWEMSNSIRISFLKFMDNFIYTRAMLASGDGHKMLQGPFNPCNVHFGVLGCTLHVNLLAACKNQTLWMCMVTVPASTTCSIVDANQSFTLGCKLRWSGAEAGFWVEFFVYSMPWAFGRGIDRIVTKLFETKLLVPFFCFAAWTYLWQYETQTELLQELSVTGQAEAKIPGS